MNIKVKMHRCKAFGFDNTYGAGGKVNAGESIDVFGSRLTSRQFARFQPFLATNCFGNDCQFAICGNNNNQNSFRLKSGVVMGWGGAW